MKRFTIKDIYHMKEKREKRKKIRMILLYILIISMVLYNSIIIYQLIVNSNQTPSILGYKSFTIISGSMEPKINIGDIVIVRNIMDNEINVGDIISFREGNSIITHRVSDIIEDGKFKTKGDANNSEDMQIVDISNIEGIYAFKIPQIGYVVIFMQNKIGIIVVAIIMYLLYLINKNKVEKKIKRKEKREMYERLNNKKTY